MTEDEMIGWHHRLDGHEVEQALGLGDGQGSLACSHSCPLSRWCHPTPHKQYEKAEKPGGLLSMESQS